MVRRKKAHVLLPCTESALILLSIAVAINRV
jgi:hypothetical protein